MGFWRGGKFHPIRASADYEPAAVGEKETAPSHYLGQFERASKKRRMKQNPLQPSGDAVEEVTRYYRKPRFKKGREWLERELGQMRLFNYNPAELSTEKFGDGYAVLLNNTVLKKGLSKSAATQYMNQLKSRAEKIQAKKNPSDYDIAAEVAEDLIETFDVDHDGDIDQDDVEFMDDFDKDNLILDDENNIVGEILAETADDEIIIRWTDGETTVEDAADVVTENGIIKRWNLRRKAGKQYKRSLRHQQAAKRAADRRREFESELSQNPADDEAAVYTVRDEHGNLNILFNYSDNLPETVVEILFEGSLDDAVLFAENEAISFGYKYANAPKSNPARKTVKIIPFGWFQCCTTADEIKVRFKELAKQHHPDKGGDVRIMQEINAAYTDAMKFAAQGETNDFKREQEQAAAEPLREALEFCATLPEDVIVTIRGLWIWLEGNTYYAKDLIKSFESSDGERFKFASKKKSWFFAGVPSRNRGGEMSFDQIDALHAKTVYSGERREKRKLNPGLLTPLVELAVGGAAALEIGDKLNRKSKKPTRRGTTAKKAVAVNPRKRQKPKARVKRKYQNNPSDPFVEFQGRESTRTLNLIKSHIAPVKMWCLGKLLEFKIKGQAEPMSFRRDDTGKTFYLCADENNKQLFVCGGKISTSDRSLENGFVDEVGEIVYVVYETEKSHLGDTGDQAYIHHFGEEGGERPMLATDNEGFAIIQGGDYKITALGIKD